MAIKLTYSKVITTALGKYHRALETRNHIYFVNFDDGDENTSVKMFNRKRQIVSDNYFANVALMEDIEKNNYYWISERLKNSLELSK